MKMIFDLFRRNDNFWPKMKWQDWLVLGAGMATFTALTVSTLTKFSIWFDEAFGSYLVRFNFYELTRYTAFDVHPPLYYWLLKIWTMMFGNTEIGIRSMSVFFGVLTVVLVFLFVLRFFGRRAAYISLALMVLSPLFLRYSQEARMYTVLTTVIVLATYVLLYAQEHAKKRWPWMVYGILLAVGMLTQYFAALAWLSHWVWRFITVWSKGDSWKEVKKKFFTREWVRAHMLAIGIFLPWLPFLVWQFVIVQGYGFWILPVNSATVPDFLTDVLLFTDSKGTLGWLAFGFYTILILSVYMTIRLLKRLDGEKKKRYLLLLVMAVAPVVLLVVLSMPPLRSAFVDRYLMAAVIFLPLLWGVSVTYSSILSKYVRISLGIIVALMMVVGISNQMILGNYNKSTGQSNNVRELLQTIRTKDSDAQILSNTPWIYYEAVIYEKPTSPIYFINETVTYEFGSLQMLEENDYRKIKDLDSFTKINKSFWLIDNLRTSEPKPLRQSWKAQESIVINDELSHQPLFKAVQYTVK